MERKKRTEHKKLFKNIDKVKGEINTNPKITLLIKNEKSFEILLKLLNSLEKLYANKYNFDVLILDNENKINNTDFDYSYNINIHNNIKNNIDNNNSDIIIFQTSDCQHNGDIIGYTLHNLKETDYFMFSCKNLENSNWYNHPNKCNNIISYCGAIHTKYFDLINSFDELFTCDFNLTIRYNLKLNVKIIDPKECFLICKNIDTSLKYKYTKEIYEDRKSHYEMNNFNYPRLLFLYWDGSNLSYLNFLTVLSFNKYHKYWKIILFTPTKKVDIMSWTNHEQKIVYNKKCYFNKLYDINNLIIKKICFDKIGFNNNISEVIKSDYFRYYALYNYGGIWSDFDIIYTNNVEKKMNFKENTVIFKLPYFPIGFFLTVPKSKFFRYILEQSLIHYNKSSYQCIGAEMFSNLFKSDNLIYNIDSSIKICDKDYYLPWEWNELDQFLVKKKNILPENNIGIHWFNGAVDSKKYAINLEERLDNFKINCFLDYIISPYINQL